MLIGYSFWRFLWIDWTEAVLAMQQQVHSMRLKLLCFNKFNSFWFLTKWTFGKLPTLFEGTHPWLQVYNDSEQIVHSVTILVHAFSSNVFGLASLPSRCFKKTHLSHDRGQIRGLWKKNVQNCDFWMRGRLLTLHFLWYFGCSQLSTDKITSECHSFFIVLLERKINQRYGTS